MSDVDRFSMRKIEKSSQIAEVGYDHATREMRVRFASKDPTKPGQLYRYHDVAPEKHQAMLAAESKGNYLNEHIKGKEWKTKPKHRYEKVNE